ncbi:MAG: hypothetical protein AAF468_20120 [Pseudomonadota bacterium]
MFESGQIVESRHTGAQVRVTGEGRGPSSFAGESLHHSGCKRFNYHWHSWATEAFDIVDPVSPAFDDVNIDDLAHELTR